MRAPQIRVLQQRRWHPDYNGALRFYDMVSQSDVTLQSSEVKEVRKDEVPLR